MYIVYEFAISKYNVPNDLLLKNTMDDGGDGCSLWRQGGNSGDLSELWNIVRYYETIDRQKLFREKRLERVIK